MQTELEQSYGGVVVRDDGCLVVIVPRGTRMLALPKGGAEVDEEGHETALREVREEAGVDAELVEELGDVQYYYRRGGRRIRKTVTFYLCRYTSGDPADHDHEVEEARWIPLEDARTALSYPGERDMVERALSALAR